MQNINQSEDYPCNIEFNLAMLDIIKNCLNHEKLYNELIDATSLVDLPTEPTSVDDFCAEVYQVRECYNSQTKH